MNNILLRVLTVVLSGVSPEPFEEKTVPFKNLPAECAAVYNTELRDFRQATATEVISVDLDGDKINELLLFNGESGSGGEGWVIMKKYRDKYRKAGEVFGILYKSDKGLIVKTPCGCNNAKWGYYELINGKLVLKLDVDVEYSKRIRLEPASLNIKMTR